MMEVLYTKGNVRDWGQSIVQLGGDDRNGIGLGTDMAISACYSRILKIYCTHFGLKLMFIIKFGAITNPYGCQLKL
jgi:hypothetical protein